MGYGWTPCPLCWWETSVELYEFVMACLLGQELSTEVCDFSLLVSSEIFAPRILCIGPGLGTKKEWPPSGA